jgi:hypothetical protein
MAFLKNIVLICVCIPSIQAMELSKSHVCGMLSLSSDIAQYKIQPFLSLEDIGRLKQTSKGCNTLYDGEKVCSFSNGRDCGSHACSILRNNYYACTKALGHCACTKNRNLFRHWWFYHAEIRYNNVNRLLHKNSSTVADQIHVYRKHYRCVSDVQKSLLVHVGKLLQGKVVFEVITILTGTNFDLFRLIGQINIFNNRGIPTVDQMVRDACALDNSDFIRFLCNGSMSADLMKYAMQYGSNNLVKELVEKKIVGSDLIDKKMRTPLHLAARYGHVQAIAFLLKAGIYVNRQDARGKTALHYATKYLQQKAVSALLTDSRLNMFCRDNLGKRPFDYVSRRSRKSEKMITMAMIRHTLNQHISNDRERDATYYGKGYCEL